MATPPRCYFLDSAGRNLFPHPSAIKFTFPADAPSSELVGVELIGGVLYTSPLAAGEMGVAFDAPVVEFRRSSNPALPQDLLIRLDTRPEFLTAIGGVEAVEYARIKSAYWWSREDTTLAGETYPKRELLGKYGRFDRGDHQDGGSVWVIPAGTLVPRADFDAILAGDLVFIR